ncbi:transmembrane protein 214-B-like [Acropora millepora]|uniref:transmembrane protein 214-B-like n=1 Tax=Acropora millepora TaxID=45264 RepID=UPI001CF5EC47|nr:transmembrane protein 214-B-like [Acropora millepora]
MASEGQWEVVGKNGKKLSAIEAKKNKGKVEMPKSEIINPLAGDKTIFQELQISKASAPKTQNGHVKLHATAVPDELPAVLAKNFPEQASEIKKRGSGFVGSKKKQAPSKPHKTDQDLLKEALAKVDVDQLTLLLVNLESGYPNNQPIWLTDVITHLQSKLKGVPQKDPSFDGKPADYPMCMLPSDLKTLLHNLLKKCSQPTLKLVYKRSVENIVQDLKNGSSPYGDQIILQCIVKQNPQVVLQNIKELQEMLASPTRQPREIVALMWCAGPLPEENLIQGLRVWMEVMLPQLTVKQPAKFIVSYLETLLSSCNKSSDEVVKVKDFIAVMELAFSEDSSLAGNPSLQRRILSLYPQLKTLSIGAETGSLSSSYFPLLMNCLSRKLSLEYQTEVLNCLLMCLEKDGECFVHWKKAYSCDLKRSQLLLKHFVDTWDSLGAALKNKIFDLVELFQVVNKSILATGKTKVGLKGCMDACEVIEGKKAKKSSFFSFGKLFKLILFLLVAVVTVDVYRHKGYKASKTAQIAKEYGVEQAALIGYGHVTEALDQGRSWVQTNYPTYYSKFREVYDPAAEFTWQKLTVAGAFIVEKSKPARDYLDAKIPVLLEKIETEVPVYFGIVRDHVQSFVDAWWPVVYKYLVIVWDFLSENVPIVLAKTQKLLVNLAYGIYELAPDFFSSIASGLAKLGEKIVEKLPGVIAVIQEYATIAFNLAVNLINSAVEQIQNMTASSEAEDVVHQKPPVTPPKSVAQ